VIERGVHHMLLHGALGTKMRGDFGITLLHGLPTWLAK